MYWSSDIPANLQIGLDTDDYYKVGEEDDLIKKMSEKLSENKIRSFGEILSAKFNWDKIAIETNNIYENLTAKNET